LNYLITLDGVIASRGGIPLVEGGKLIGAIGCSGGTASQDEVCCKAAAATIIDLCIKNAIIVFRGRTPMPRLKGSSDLLEDRRKRALALLDSGCTLTRWGGASV